MAWIGYSDSGYTELEREIKNRKARLVNVLESFTEVYNAINDCWKGEDATAYNAELKRVITTTIGTVNDAYNTLEKQCRMTHEDWIQKQRG